MPEAASVIELDGEISWHTFYNSCCRMYAKTSLHLALGLPRSLRPALYPVDVLYSIPLQGLLSRWANHFDVFIY